MLAISDNISHSKELMVIDAIRYFQLVVIFDLTLL